MLKLYQIISLERIYSLVIARTPDEALALLKNEYNRTMDGKIIVLPEKLEVNEVTRIEEHMIGGSVIIRLKELVRTTGYRLSI